MSDPAPLAPLGGHGQPVPVHMPPDSPGAPHGNVAGLVALVCALTVLTVAAVVLVLAGHADAAVLPMYAAALALGALFAVASTR